MAAIHSIALSFLLMTVLTVSTVWADTTITLQGTAGAADTVIQVKGSMARMMQSGQPSYALFDKSRNTAIYVDASRQEYQEIDQQTLDKYAGTVAAVRQQMQAQLQMLPPAQRAMVEKQMGNMVGSPAGSMPDLESMRSVPRGSRSVAGFKCRVHELLQGDEPVGEVCLANAADAGVSAADFSTLMAMMDFMRAIAGSAQKLSGQFGAGTTLLIDGLQGVPVAGRDYRRGYEFLVATVSDETLDANLFNGYRSYRRQNLLDALPMGQ